MVYVNPTTISNSGNAEYYTNQKAKIHMLIFNIIQNSNNYNNFLVQEFNEQQLKSGSNIQTNTSDTNNFINILEYQKNNSKSNKYKC